MMIGVPLALVTGQRAIAEGGMLRSVEYQSILVSRREGRVDRLPTFRCLSTDGALRRGSRSSAATG